MARSPPPVLPLKASRSRRGCVRASRIKARHHSRLSGTEKDAAARSPNGRIAITAFLAVAVRRDTLARAAGAVPDDAAAAALKISGSGASAHEEGGDRRGGMHQPDDHRRAGQPHNGQTRRCLMQRKRDSIKAPLRSIKHMQQLTQRIEVLTRVGGTPCCS